MVQLYFSTEMTGVLFRVSASRKRGLGGSQEKRKKKKAWHCRAGGRMWI